VNTYEHIGQQLKEARDRCGLTQEQAAKYLGVVREALSYYENGRREIDLVTLKKLADLYGYSIEYFLSESPIQTKDTIGLAFRANEIKEQDLEVVAWAQRVALNLQDLDNLLSKG
jgi:transcriptional regulator with XRE-family HTH domain